MIVIKVIENGRSPVDPYWLRGTNLVDKVENATSFSTKEGAERVARGLRPGNPDHTITVEEV